MIKFVVLLTMAISFNFTISFGEYLGISNDIDPQEILLVFSENQIGVESGQPVYPVNTKVFIKCTEQKELTISINGGKEIKKNAAKVDLSNYLDPYANTYTVVVEVADEGNKSQKIFGFTTK